MVLAFGAIACSDDEGMDDIGVLQLTASLTEEDGPGASGEADLSINGEGILLSLVMEGLTEGAHANHLHHGSCDELGEIHITLDGIVADSAGDGSQTTGNDEAPLSHFDTGHYLAVHAEDVETIGAVVACGEVVGG